MFNNVGVREIWQENSRILSVLWTDEIRSNYDVVLLRSKCPCAICVKDKDKDKDKMQKYEKIRQTLIRSVGRYAVTIEFDDGHKTGLYSFSLLRSLGQENSN